MYSVIVSVPRVYSICLNVFDIPREQPMSVNFSLVVP
jgi:hypothetical protein